jgi:lysozyme
MRISERGLELIKDFEGCRLTAYPDPKTGGDPWTIGYGATGRDIAKGTVWTQIEADRRLEEDVLRFELYVSKAVIVPMTQGQFDAMTSITFNVGPGSSSRDGIIRLKSGQPSTLLRKLNAGDYVGAAAQFSLWISKGSPAEAGLRRRRAAELALFWSP